MSREDFAAGNKGIPNVRVLLGGYKDENCMYFSTKTKHKHRFYMLGINPLQGKHNNLQVTEFVHPTLQSLPQHSWSGIRRMCKKQALPSSIEKMVSAHD